MTGTPNGLQGGGTGGRSPRTVITSAQFATSKGQASRQRRYAITMAFRTACFLSMIFVPGPLRWVLFACAVFLPYVAVLFANQADTRTGKAEVEQAGSPALQLGAGAPAPEIIHGTVVEPEAYGPAVGEIEVQESGVYQPGLYGGRTVDGAESDVQHRRKAADQQKRRSA